MLRLCLLVACGCGGKSDDGPTSSGVPVARFVFHEDTMTQADRAVGESIEIAGVSGRGSVDVPLAKLPKDLKSVTVTLTWATPCGPKQLVTPLAPNDRGRQYALEPADAKEYGWFYSATLPYGKDYPQPTRVYLDPALDGPLAIGALRGTVAKGVPDDKLASGQPTTGGPGFWVQDADCGNIEIAVGGKTTTVPAGRGGLFITADDKACFTDEHVGYGTDTTRGTDLRNANVYRLHASTVEVFFAPAPKTANAGRSGGTDLSRLARCE